jgi:type III secretion system YscQ/HrcQ family protein
MAAWVEIKGDRISFLRIMVGFLPLAFGYFLSVLFQGIDPLVADDLMTDLDIGKGTLGMLAAAFPLAFAICLLPSGIAIDRFGLRTVQSSMMGVMALGALMSGLSTGSFGLIIGRMLLGAASASALLAGMKAAVTWFPRERLGLVTGCLIAAAGLGALAMASPGALLVQAFGWRALFFLLAALATLSAILTALLVSTPATVTGVEPDQDRGLSFVLRDPLFRRFAPLAAIVVGTAWALQGQWVAGWLASVSGLKITGIVTHIAFIAIGQTIGALVWGGLADGAVRVGRSAASIFVGAVALSVCIQIAAVGGIALPNSIVWGALVAGAAATLPFVVLLTHFPPAYAARACASIGLLQYLATFVLKWAVDGVVGSGQTSATAYAMAFMVPIALQVAALAWFLFPRSQARDRAHNVDEFAAAFASARSAVEPANTAVEPIGTASATPETDGEPAVAAVASAETAEPPPDSVVKPADVEVQPIGTALASTETDIESVAAAPASTETVEAPPDIPAEPASFTVEPVDTPDAMAETVAVPAVVAVEPTEAALRSILDAPLSIGLGSVIDTNLRASADTPKLVAPISPAETAPPAERALTFPRIAPSHVQALNAVYRQRPPLAAMIGGRRMSIVAAWPPDRRLDASHRVGLRLDGEPGELWLPQSLLDILVDSVDPVLSLDRLGPDRAAIILEFALEGVLATVERNLGCKLAVESYASKVERSENDGQVPLFFTLVIDGVVTSGCELRIPPDDALRLAQGLDRHAGISDSVLDLPIPVCLRVAAANLAAAEIERLSPDDVVLVDASCEPVDAVIAVIGERLAAPVTLGPEGPRLATYPIPGATSSWAWSMQTDAMAGAWEADAETDNRSLHVLFELGRFELPASQVKQLAPNFLLPLETPHDRTVDIVVDGQRIGRGTLMRIGNRTGVRIMAVRERSGAAAGLKRAPAVEH